MPLTIDQFEQTHNVRLMRKDESKTMSLVGKFSKSFMYNSWTTYRLPWQKKATITYPISEKRPMKKAITLEHELVHVADMATFKGLLKTTLLYFIFPLPVFFSGRWFVERKAFLVNIRAKDRTVDDVVYDLWNSYGCAWPRRLMKKWFEDQLKK